MDIMVGQLQDTTQNICGTKIAKTGPRVVIVDKHKPIACTGSLAVEGNEEHLPLHHH